MSGFQTAEAFAVASGAIDGIQRPYFLAVIVQSLQRRASPVWAVRPSLRQARSPQRAERVGNARRF